MNDFDWTAIEAANEARVFMAARAAAGWKPDTANADHATCDHANDYCANTLNNYFTQGVSA